MCFLLGHLEEATKQNGLRAAEAGGHRARRYYTTYFEAAVADLDADQAASLASIFRPGGPAGVGKVSPNAVVTRNGGRFGAAHRAPPTQPDPALWPPADFDVLVQEFRAHGFRPSCAWYLNDDAAIVYAREAYDGGRLSQPIPSSSSRAPEAGLQMSLMK